MKKLAPLLLLAPLALGSCGLFNRAPKPVTTAGGTLMDAKVTYDANGNATTTYTAWSGGAGKVMLDLYDYTAKTTVKEGEATLAADGKFSFASLPTPKDSELSPYTEETQPTGCTSTVKVSDKGMRSATATFRTDATKDVSVMLMDAAGTTTTMGELIYVDRAVKLSGKQECKFTGLTSIADINVSFTKGWNWLTIKATTDLTTSTTTAVMTNGFASNLKWVNRTAATQALNLNTLPFTLR
ncbi:hypothetical protein DEIGR_100442 [Deinococcus grandis]|uniref:Lipoprotein n=1 Tax=Deinococcus grandis TaxID=57498 RepID=A0A124BR86_9DEIO|nr:hypothetical protein [Deinococcus grandis]BBN96103.1 hypothetical protein DEGR_28360 [Deinococcus grandis]GAQ20415.1 hypothetical protein DEIGR_100442 [Deinococcus grandis]